MYIFFCVALRSIASMKNNTNNINKDKRKKKENLEEQFFSNNHHSLTIGFDFRLKKKINFSKQFKQNQFCHQIRSYIRIYEQII